MPTSVALGHYFESFVRSQVESGRFNNASEVVRAGLRLLDESEQRRQLELERLEQMLNYLNTHFESVISLQELADQVHLSREVCCRLFKKMTGKTITGYLEEYRVNQSLPLVQSCQYSMIQIADMTGFSNASRFARAFRRQFGCNPGEYNSLKLQKC